MMTVMRGALSGASIEALNHLLMDFVVLIEVVGIVANAAIELGRGDMILLQQGGVGRIYLIGKRRHIATRLYHIESLEQVGLGEEVRHGGLVHHSLGDALGAMAGGECND